MHQVPAERQTALASFIEELYRCYVADNFTYLEINPLVMIPITSSAEFQIFALDMAAKIDETAKFECPAIAAIEFPTPFGRLPMPEEAFIANLDAKTGASLKLTVLNMEGRVWTMVAGGGASVVYADTIADLGWGEELANYGEYSGAPSQELTYEYAKTIMQLLLRAPHASGKPKVLLIGGGIANFTDVASTFTGITIAMREVKDQLRDQNVQIYVRRGGPNYQEGLRIMHELGEELDIALQVFGPEHHVTNICSLALGVPLSNKVRPFVRVHPCLCVCAS